MRYYNNKIYSSFHSISTGGSFLLDKVAAATAVTSKTQ